MNPALRFLSVLVLLALSPSGAAAQSVRGEVRDLEYGRAIPLARLLLLDTAGVTVDSTLADAAGRYRLHAPAAGAYVVYFALDGWAAVASSRLELRSGEVRDFEFRVQLVANETLREMREIIGLEPRLQAALPEMCGEPFRPWEAGLLVGRVRARSTGQPASGVRIAVVAADGGARVRGTVSGDHGVYVLCNVPAGTGIGILTETTAGALDTTRVEIRAGTAAWYDLMVGPRRR